MINVIESLNLTLMESLLLQSRAARTINGSQVSSRWLGTECIRIDKLEGPWSLRTDSKQKRLLIFRDAIESASFGAAMVHTASSL